MRRMSTILLFCASLVLLAYACSSKLQAIEGKWQEVGGRETIEFLHDGTFKGVMIWDMNQKPITISGNYEVEGDNLDLSVTEPKDLAPMTWTMQFSSGKDLTLIYRDGGALKRDGASGRYRRVT
jgi:hypothetical protein